jgi:hypothetical protein
VAELSHSELTTMTESEWKFPAEILEKIAAACDHDYASQAKMCLVSQDLFIFTQPRLYRSFNSILTSPQRHELFLGTIITNSHLADLVQAYCLISPADGWPRAVNIALFKIRNLKHLTLINRQPREHSDFKDLWHDIFQSSEIPFQLHSLQLLWIGPDNSYPFESMSLTMFLKHQIALKTLHLYYHTALLNDNDLPNLQTATIESRNWDHILPGRPIRSLILEGDIEDARRNIKQVLPGSPIAATLKNLKQLRIDAEVMDTYLLSLFLPSLEVLIITKFTKVSF